MKRTGNVHGNKVPYTKLYKREKMFKASKHPPKSYLQILQLNWIRISRGRKIKLNHYVERQCSCLFEFGRFKVKKLSGKVTIKHGQS